MFVLRLIYSRPALIVLTVVFLILGVDAFWQHLDDRLAELAGLRAWPSDQDDDLAVILIAYGVLLEERGPLFRRIHGHLPDAGDEALNHTSEIAGALMLVAGLFIEVLDVSGDLLFGMSVVVGQAGVVVILLLHAVGAWLLLRYLWDLFRASRRAA